MTRNEWLISFVEEMRPYFEMMDVALPGGYCVKAYMVSDVSGEWSEWFIRVGLEFKDGLTAGQFVTWALLQAWSGASYQTMSRRLGIEANRYEIVTWGPVIMAMLKATVAKLGPYPYPEIRNDT
jgi:hypothetical protein